MVKPVRVLIVDDSALIRQILKTILSNDPEIEVVGTAQDALKARELIKKLNPDVITLDVEMPKMNGIEFLKKIMSLRPMPVVMVSTLTQKGADITFEALAIGAVDYVGKPQNDVKKNMQEMAEEICLKVKTAAGANLRHLGAKKEPVETNKTLLNKVSEVKLIVVGSSTGGVEAIRTVLSGLPADMPPICIVQHMPKNFTGTFSKRLNTVTELKVFEAEDMMPIERGHVYIAPGDKHLIIAKQQGGLVCRLMGGKPVSGHIPSVDVLFDSACQLDPKNTISVMLSGMGRDGADNMKKLRDLGAYTIGQDEASCVVYGMPKAAYEKGAVIEQVSLTKISKAIIKRC